MGGVSPLSSHLPLSLSLSVSVYVSSASEVSVKGREGEKTMMERAEPATASALMRATSSRLHV